MEFIVISSLLVIGFIFSFFHKSINLSLWKNKLENRIGPLPDEAYISYNVLHGHEGPLVNYLTIVFLLGIFSIPFTINNEYFLLTIFLFMCPVSIFLPILLVNIFRSNKEPEGREKMIEILDLKIESDGKENNLLHLYQRYWRSMYRLDLIDVLDIETVNTPDTLMDRLKSAKADLDLCVMSKNSDKFLINRSKRGKHLIPGLINKVESIK